METQNQAKKKMSNKRFAAIWCAALSILVIAVIVANALLMQYANLITRVMNHSDTMTVKKSELSADADAV